MAENDISRENKRKALETALAQLENKKLVNPAKKHGNMPT